MRVVAGATVIVVSAVIFANSLDNYFVSDDWGFLFDAAQTQTSTELLRLMSFETSWFVRPTQWLVTWALYHLFGLSPIAYHLASILLHLVNVLLLFIFVHRLLGLQNYELPKTSTYTWISMGTAIIFMLNFRHHESIFWYSSINELLSTFFRIGGLVALTVWIAAVETPQKYFLTSLVILAYVGGLASKENAIVYPAEIAALLLAVGFSRRSLRTLLPKAIPMFVGMGSIFLVWAYAYLRSSGSIGGTGTVERGGLMLISASPHELILRTAQYLNSALMIPGRLNQHSSLLIAELVVLALLAFLTFRQRRFFWLFALSWSIIATLPYVVMTSREANDLGIPALMLGTGGDRFKYHAAAGAALFFILSVCWLQSNASSLLSHRLAVVSRSVAIVVVGLYVGLSASTLAAHERGWDKAGNMAESILDSVKTALPEPKSQSLICLSNLPDALEGKYVFRNGIEPAIMLHYGRTDLSVRATIEPANQWQRVNDLDTQDCTMICEYYAEDSAVRCFDD